MPCMHVDLGMPRYRPFQIQRLRLPVILANMPAVDCYRIGFLCDQSVFPDQEKKQLQKLLLHGA